MTDVMKLARDKRARLMGEIEERMAEVERLDNFLMFGTRLSSEEGKCEEPKAEEYKPDDYKPEEPKRRDHDGDAEYFAAE